MSIVLRTPRAVLREFTKADLDVVAGLMADEEQMRLYPRPRTRDETDHWIRRNLELYEEHGFGFWLVESPGSCDFLGYCGIRPAIIERMDEIEMGWHTKKQFWSQGLGTEVASACRDLAFSKFNIPRLVATIDRDNAPSIRIAKRIGMQLEKEAVLYGWPCLVYFLERDRERGMRK